jgi:hypothetical protein
MMRRPRGGRAGQPSYRVDRKPAGALEKRLYDRGQLIGAREPSFSRVAAEDVGFEPENEMRDLCRHSACLHSAYRRLPSPRRPPAADPAAADPVATDHSAAIPTPDTAPNRVTAIPNYTRDVGAAPDRPAGGAARPAASPIPARCGIGSAMMSSPNS